VDLEAELVEEAAQGPDVCLLVDWLIAVEVNHLRGTVHGSRVALNLSIRAMSGSKVKKCYIYM
jgi:hypothetical protein